MASWLSSASVSSNSLTARISQREGRSTRLLRRCSAVKAEAPKAKESLAEQLERLRRENEELKKKVGSKMGSLPAAAPAKSATGSTNGATQTAAPVKSAAVVPLPSVAVKSAQVEVIGDLNTKVPTDIAWPAPGELFWERRPAANRGQQGRTVAKDGRTYHVVHVAAELAPVAKVGGLGDVVTGLARAGKARGHWAEVYLPFYELLDEKLSAVDHVMDFTFDVGRQFNGQTQSYGLKTSVFRSEVMGVPVFLFRPDNNFFKGKQIYGGGYSSTEAYLYFSRAALEFLKRKGDQPDIIHIHDWHTAPLAMLYWDYYSMHIKKASCMLTVHNFAQLGECRLEEFAATGFPGEPFMTAERALDERTIGHNPERMCLLKGGLVYSNAITTVSPTYAREVSGNGNGWLQSLLKVSSDKFQGIVNGIDDDIWNPLTDPFLPANYSARNPQNKAICKKFVQMGMGMRVTEDQRVPLVICISRLVPQKGVHMIEHAVRYTLAKGGQFILLGTGGSDGPLRAMAGQSKDDPDLRFVFAFSDELSHYLYAAADMVLVPSIFEPCGLTQMLGQKYGAVPIVRRTGGLADTVDPSAESGTGFSFDGQGQADVCSAVEQALSAYQEKARWDALVRRCMSKDNSWDTAFSSYVDIYNRIAR